MAEQSQDTNSESLLDQLQNSKDAYARKVAAEQLGEQTSATEEIIEALRNSVQSDTNKYVREAAQKSLINLNVEKDTITAAIPSSSTEKKALTLFQSGMLGAIIGFVSTHVIGNITIGDGGLSDIMGVIICAIYILAVFGCFVSGIFIVIIAEAFDLTTKKYVNHIMVSAIIAISILINWFLWQHLWG